MISVLLGLESTLLSATRLPFTMAEDGYFHPKLAQLHSTYRTPVAAIVLSAALCAGLALFSLTSLIAVYTWLRVATSLARTSQTRSSAASTEPLHRCPPAPTAPPCKA